jgi:hypothetical protein
VDKNRSCPDVVYSAFTIGMQHSTRILDCGARFSLRQTPTVPPVFAGSTPIGRIHCSAQINTKLEDLCLTLDIGQYAGTARRGILRLA